MINGTRSRSISWNRLQHFFYIQCEIWNSKKSKVSGWGAGKGVWTICTLCTLRNFLNYLCLRGEDCFLFSWKNVQIRMVMKGREEILLGPMKRRWESDGVGGGNVMGRTESKDAHAVLKIPPINGALQKAVNTFTNPLQKLIWSKYFAINLIGFILQSNTFFRLSIFTHIHTDVSFEVCVILIYIHLQHKNRTQMDIIFLHVALVK